MRPKTKQRYLRILLLRLKKHWSARQIAEHFGYTAHHVRTVLRRPDLQVYVKRLRRGFLWHAQKRFAEVLREVEVGTYDKPRIRKPPKRRIRKKFTSFQSALRNILGFNKKNLYKFDTSNLRNIPKE